MAQGVRFRPYPRTLLTGAVRGLVVSPWFAAGAGFVVAAGAFMYAPHAQLSIGNPLIHTAPCKVPGCQHTTEQGGAPPMAAGGGALLPPPASPSPSASPPPVTAGLTFWYAVNLNWPTSGTFRMVLTVTGKKAIGNWRLAFVIPGATHISVVGADWQQSGTDGGTATGRSFVESNQPAESPSTPGPGRPSPSPEADSSDQPYLVYFTVYGDGTPSAPDSCTFDGVQCHFSPGPN